MTTKIEMTLEFDEGQEVTITCADNSSCSDISISQYGVSVTLTSIDIAKISQASIRMQNMFSAARSSELAE